MEQPQSIDGRWVLLMMIGSIALWAVMVFGTLAHLRAIAGGLDPFDMRPFGYDAVQARTLLAALGEGGRDFYADVQLRLDAVYPASYALSRGLALWWSTARGRLRAAPIPTYLRIALLLPSIVTAGFDYTENFQIARMLAAGPGVDGAIVETASRMTLIKSLVGAVNETGVIVLVVMVAMRWRRQQQR